MSSRCATPTTARWSAPCRRRAPNMCAKPSPRRRRSSRSSLAIERQQILQKTAELLRDRKEIVRPHDLGRSRASAGRTRSTKSSRAYDVWSFAAQLTDPRRRRDLTPAISRPTARRASISHDARAAARRHLGDHAVQPPAQHGEPQAGAGDRHQQPRRAEADRADAAHRAGARRRALRGRAAAGDALGRHRQPFDHGRCDDHRSRCGPGDLHRLGARRQAHRRDRRLQAHRARARRQRPADRDGRRRSRQGGRTRRAGRDQELRPALHGRQAHPGRREGRGRVQRRWCWRRPGS